MKRRVVKHRKAKRDVLRIFVYIGDDNLNAAHRFLAAFDNDRAVQILRVIHGAGDLERALLE